MKLDLKNIISEISSGTTEGRIENKPLLKEYSSIKSKDGLSFLLGSMIKEASNDNTIDLLANNLLESLDIKSEQDLKNFAMETTFLQSNSAYKELLESMSNVISGKSS